MIMRYKRIAKKIQKRVKKLKYLSDDQLKKQTALLRKKLESRKNLEKILIEAYATVCEADRRVLGMSPYFSQIIGGLILHYGNIAEMKTGEGKTLTATMPLYLHGLLGEGVFLITANPYLAKRDVKNIGRVYQWLGLTVEVGVSAEGDDDSERDLKRIYSADIVYTTHSGLGFDYLFDNLATTLDKKYLHNFNFVIIDEIDSILLDQAQTPLIVSGAPRVQSNLFETSERIIHQLKKNIDFHLSEDLKNVWLTTEGIHHIEVYLGIKKLLGEQYKKVYRHIVIALKANYLFNKDRDYVVENNRIVLLDKMNGRKLEGTKMQSGLHQALEAKEHVDLTEETRAMASITYQNLFRLFKVMSGMTGTAKTDAEEFRDIYHLNTIVVPTNKKVIRKDYPDKIYVDNQDKIESSLKEVSRAQKQKRPILIETGSVSMSDLYSRLLLSMGYAHNVLNATSIAKENKIISEAGNSDSITVATSMAGRGTDIKISPEALKNGGLLVVGTERMSSARIDNQLRGRAGRQGEPGESIFYVSLQDKIIIENAPEWVKNYRKSMQSTKENNTEKQIKKRRFRKIVDKAQKVQKNAEVSERSQTIEYDEVMKIQRNYLYKIRNRIMRAENIDKWLNKSIYQALNNFCQNVKNESDLNNFVFNNIDYSFVPNSNALPQNWIKRKKKVIEYLLQIVKKRNNKVKEMFSNSDQAEYYKRLVLLKSIDAMWIEQVDALQQLKGIVSGRSWGQHNPIYEYQDEARASFRNMKKGIYLSVLRNFLLSEIVYKSDGTMDIIFP